MPDYFIFHKRCSIRYESSDLSIQKLKQSFKGVLRINSELATRRKKLLPQTTNGKLEKQTSINIQLIEPREVKADLNKENKTSNTIKNILSVNALENFKKNLLQSFGIDLFNVSGTQLDKIFQNDQFDGRIKFLREQIFLPKTASNEGEITLWSLKQVSETLILNKKSQGRLLKMLGRYFKGPFLFNWENAVEILSLAEQMFVDEYLIGKSETKNMQNEEEQFAVFDIYI